MCHSLMHRVQLAPLRANKDLHRMALGATRPGCQSSQLRHRSGALRRRVREIYRNPGQPRDQHARSLCRRERLWGAGDCALLGESFLRSPEIASIRSGEYRAIRSFDLSYAKQAEAIAAVDCVSWKAPDGLEIQGWLLLNTQRRLNSNFSSLEHTSGSDELLETPPVLS
jgi:hypothetical protein